MLNGNAEISYPSNATVNGSCGVDSGTCFLFGNITSNGMIELSVDDTAPFFVWNSSKLAVGVYNFTVNNTNNASGRKYTLTIGQAIANVTLKAAPSSPITFLTQTQANCSTNSSFASANLYTNRTGIMENRTSSDN